jgi:thioredoxin-like negative regulator of GroEL
VSGETEQQEIRAWVIALLEAHRREVDGTLEHLEELWTAHRDGDREAVEKAFASATKLSEAHNDLLRKMEKLSETFATRESVDSALDALVDSRREARDAEEKTANVRFTRLEQWQAKITGGMLVLGAIGLSNFVRLWT